MTTLQKDLIDLLLFAPQESEANFKIRTQELLTKMNDEDYINGCINEYMSRELEKMG